MTETVSATRPTLAVRGLDVRLRGARASGHALSGRQILSGVDMTIDQREIVGLIGETGSGKTTLARAVMGLVEPEAGSIEFDGRDITHLRPKERQAFRREGTIQFVFQDPLRSLDPDYTVIDIVREGLAVRGDGDLEAQRTAALAALVQAGLDPAISHRRPAQISGGQRQRVAIARAIVMQPKLLILDEPVSALDASTRNFVLRLLADLHRELKLAMVVISHDLASLAGVADHIAVLYRGRLVEEGSLAAIFSAPLHPYTALLLSSAPSLAGISTASLPPRAKFRGAEFDEEAPTPGCAFAPRCPFATEQCVRERPESREIAPGWKVACHNAVSWQAAPTRATTGV